ncbi:MAG TPA: pyridoxal-dependent decarboxylase [Candidatus Acidoferrum sp.]|nr:pyridoxal-dependent decarboxylase [Candidatus Acidoferrum sp.]
MHQESPPNTTTTDLADPPPGDVSPTVASQSLAWLQSYLLEHFGGVTTAPVAGSWTKGQLRQAAGPLPDEPRTLPATIAFFESHIAPGLLRWNHPRFAAYFATSAPAPSIIAEALVAAHNSNLMLASASPAGAELEAIVGQWYQQLLGVPAGLSPQFFTSASQSHQHALVAALNQKTRGLARRAGLAGQPPFAVYTSELGHFFARKNAVAAGLGEDHVRAVPADERGAMDLAVLEKMIAADLAAGLQPLMVIATVGTTSITSVDEVPAIAQICRRHSIWCYVDAAYGGAFACLPECRWAAAGWDLADAVCVNPHKGLFVPQGCSLLFLRDRQALRRVCDHRADYLPDSDRAEGDPMDFTFVCGLRVNTLASFFNLMTFGAEGIRRRVRALLALAVFAAGRIAGDPMFELLASPRFSTVCFTLRAGPSQSPQALDAIVTQACRSIQSAGRCCLSQTRYRSRVWFRLAIGNINTSRDDVDFILDQVRQAVLQAKAA